MAGVTRSDGRPKRCAGGQTRRLERASAPREDHAVDLEARVRELLGAGTPDLAATEVIVTLGPQVLGYLCALHGDDDGEDVFADWAEGLWKALPAFRFEASLRTWAYRVAWSASTHFRRDPWRARRQRLSTGAASRLAASVTRAAAPAPDERLEALRRRLGEEDQTLLILHVSRELTFEEIALVLAGEGGPPPAATLRKRYQRVRARLARWARGAKRGG